MSSITQDPVSVCSSMNSPLVVQPKRAMPSASRTSQMLFRSRLTELNTTARVGLKAAVMVSVIAHFSTGRDLPLIDLASIDRYSIHQLRGCQKFATGEVLKSLKLGCDADRGHFAIIIFPLA